MVTAFVMVAVAIVVGMLVQCSLFGEDGEKGSGVCDAIGDNGGDGGGFASDVGGGQEKNQYNHV